jgi:hypothetical protein
VTAPENVCSENSLSCSENSPSCPENIPAPGSTPKRFKPELALAIAIGTPVVDWARQRKVPIRTAYRWAKQPKVRAAAEAHRRRALDRAVGRMTHSLDWVTKGIEDLAKGAASESVQLSALRSVVSDVITVSKFGSLEDRVTELEEKANARNRNKDRAR